MEMVRKNNSILIHKYLLLQQATKVKVAMSLMLEKDSLNDTDIQAIKILADVYGVLVNPPKEMPWQNQATDNNSCLQDE